MHLSRFMQKYLAVFGVVLACYACTNDTWDQHYNSNSEGTSNETLWSQLQKQDTLSDFVELLDSVNVLNGNKITDVLYSQLLEQQYFTVFAPVNGSFNKDSLLQLCETAEGNKQVVKRFILSHLTRTPYSLSEYTNKMAKMVNGKYLPLGNYSLAEIPVLQDYSNIVAKNGLIHCVSKAIPYKMNLYEYLTTDSTYSGMGKFLTKFEQEELNETASVEGGLDEAGNIIYVDSVMTWYNNLLYSFGRINSEDSTFRVVAPTKLAWDAAYAKVSKYFNYPINVIGRDSLQDYWTNYSLMRDMVFNWNMQLSPQDSVTSTQYYPRNFKYHVFHKPFDAGGILADAQSVTASNGVLYKTNNWAYDIEDVFFMPLTIEAEYASNINAINKEKNPYNMRYTPGDTISANGFMDVNSFTPTSVQNPINLTFYLPNTLSGKYDVCIVLLPKTVRRIENFTPNRFIASLSYLPAGSTTRKTGYFNGTSTLATASSGATKFTNNPYKVDTITLGTVTLPTSSYNITNLNAAVTINISCPSSTISPAHLNAGTYSYNMYIDCFYLKPRQD